MCIRDRNEYRVVEKNRKTFTDFSLYTNNSDRFEGHFFYKSDIDINSKNFSNTSLKLIFENSTDDLYLKANNLVSPLIKQNDLLEKSVKEISLDELLKTYSQMLDGKTSGRYLINLSK